MTILLVLFGLILFVGLVVGHELGHFYLARRSGVVVEEFGVGFPPRAWSKKLKSGLLFSINWLPLGGFVKLKGEYDACRDKGSFGAARLKDKVLILIAGVTVNYLLAVGLFTVVALVGMPQIIEGQFRVASDSRVVRRDVVIDRVSQDSPAAKAGLKEGDRLVSIGPNSDTKVSVSSADILPSLTSQNAGQSVVLDYRRGSDLRSASVQLLSTEEVVASRSTDQPKGYLGIVPTEFILERSTWSAPIVAVGTTVQLTRENFKGLGRVLADIVRGRGKAASDQVGGPVRVARLVFDSSVLGYQALLFVMAIISLTLAVMNLLPIPALDGGRLFVILLFRLLGKPLTKGREELIHGLGFVGLIGLIILVSILDTVKMFGS